MKDLKNTKPNNYLELLSSHMNYSTNFIKMYKPIRHLKLSSLREALLIDILQLNLQGKSYEKKGSTIAQDIVTSEKNVYQVVKYLKKRGLITVENIPNRKKESWGGSRFVLSVNHEKIVTQIMNSITFQAILKDKVNENELQKMISDLGLSTEPTQQPSTKQQTTEEISKQQPDPVQEGIEEPVQELLKTQPAKQEVIEDNVSTPTEEYPFVTENISPKPFLLRYAPECAASKLFLKELQPYWVKNCGNRVGIDIDFFLEYLNHYWNTHGEHTEFMVQITQAILDDLKAHQKLA